MAQRTIDLDTVQPNGKRGETQRPAFTKINDNFAEVYGALGSVATIVEDVEQLKTEIEKEAEQAKAEVRNAIATLPAAVDSAIHGRIPGKNRLINGNFDLWTRGTPVGQTGYGPDRWFVQIGLMTDASVFASNNVPGDGVFDDARLSMGTNSTGNQDAFGHYFVFEQRVENVRTFAGVVSTVSFTVYNPGAAGRKIAIEFLQNFGTGGSETILGVDAEIFSLAQGVNHISKTVTLPSVSGKTVASTNHYAAVAVWLSSGNGFDVRNAKLGAQSGQLFFGGFQWEQGGTATGYDTRPLSHEAALCGWYAQRIDISAGDAFSVCTALGQFDCVGQLSFQPMRSKPTARTLGGGVNMTGFGIAGGNAPGSSFNIIPVSVSGAAITAGVATGGMSPGASGYIAPKAGGISIILEAEI